MAFGRGFLSDIWYFLAPASAVKAGRLERFELLGEPVVLGRTQAGEVFALRDICPHRAAPLSAGRMAREADGRESIECPYHGWRFGTDGVCTAIPSLVRDQALDVSRIGVRRYPTVESQGMIFVWVAEEKGGEPDQPPPVFPGVQGQTPAQLAQALGVGGGEAGAGAGEKGRQVLEIAAVGRQRVVAGALLGREHVEKQLGKLVV